MTEYDGLVGTHGRIRGPDRRQGARVAATVLLVAAVVIDVGSFWLGLQALSGGIESVWAVLGIVFGGDRDRLCGSRPVADRLGAQARAGDRRRSALARRQWEGRTS